MTFEEIYKAYWPKVYRISMGYVNDHDWAKDLAQDTFITVFQKLPDFRNGSSIGTWVFKIASNHCLRQIEKQKRMPKTDLPGEIEDIIQNSTEGKMVYLYKCISELPETDRIIISLELEDVKQAEIATIVGISEANVRVRIYRIKEKLTQKISGYEQ